MDISEARWSRKLHDESNKSHFASVSVDGYGDLNVIVVNVRD